jgi:hypothetical protein
MHPVTQRWLLIQELDGYAMIACLSYFLFLGAGDILKHYKWKWTSLGCKVFAHVLVFIVFGYFIWRIFFAWKGIYY